MWFSISLRYRNVLLSRLTKVDEPHFMLLVCKCSLCDPYKVLTLYHIVNALQPVCMEYQQHVSIFCTLLYVTYEFTLC